MEADDAHQSFKMNKLRIERKTRQVTTTSSATTTTTTTSKMSKLASTLLLALHLIAQLALASMSLPGGIENILGFVPKSTFVCERDGYFGDIDNDCRIFHLCQRNLLPNGRTEWRHWTYACGNQTMFNQLTLTCAFVDEAIPCRHASQFQYLNEVIHKPKEPFLTDADVTSGISYYSNRVMSDGARARAFEDSSLMAQIGGQATAASIAASNQAAQQDSFAGQPAFSDDDLSPSRTINSLEAPSIEPFRPATVAAPSRIPQKRQNLHQSFQQAQVQAPQWPPQLQPFPASPRLADPNAEFIINHQHNFQHTPSNQAAEIVSQQQQQQFAPIQHQLNRFQERAHQQVQVRPQQQQTTRRAAAIVRQAEPIGRIFAEPREDNQEELVQIQPAARPPLLQVQQQQQRPAIVATQVQPIDSTPKSFEFSIATDHRQGPASGNNQALNLPALEPSSFTFPSSGNQQPQFAPTTTIVQPQFALASAAPTQTNPPPPSPSSSLAPTTTTIAAPKLTDLPANFGSLVPTTPVAISRASEAPTIATTSASVVTTSTANDFLLNTQPSTELTSSPVTATFGATNTIVPAPQPTTPAIVQRAPVPFLPATVTPSALEQAQRKPVAFVRATNQLSARQQRNLQNDLVFDRLHSSFQSTRLSAQSSAAPRQQLDSARPRRSESALVMRKQPLETISGAESSSAVASSAVASAADTSALSGSQKAKSAAIFDSEDFWRRPFDMHFLAPKFEHMLTRRRV